MKIRSTQQQFPRIGLIATLAMLTSISAQAVTNGQTDDSEDGTTQSWRVGAPGDQPFNVATGGPAGVDDNYVQYNSDAAGPSGRMIFFNSDQWAGDYLAEGITEITLDVFNLSTFQPLNLRLAFGTSISANSGSWFASTDSIDVDPGVGWTSITFPITQSDLTSVLGSDSYNDVLSSVAVVRILSSGAPANKGDRITAMIGVDNIMATPEPASVVLVLASLALLRRR